MPLFPAAEAEADAEAAATPSPLDKQMVRHPALEPSCLQDCVLGGHL